MKKQNLNLIFVLAPLFLVLIFIFVSKTYACPRGDQIHTIKKHSSEDDILEFVEFLRLNYEHEFEIVPELDGIDFFASSLNKEVCYYGFNIYLDANNLTIRHALDQNSCNELTEKIVADFQHQKNLPEERRIKVICDSRL